MIDGWNFDNAVKKQRKLLTRCPDLPQFLLSQKAQGRAPVLADLYAFGVNSLSPARGIRGQAFPLHTDCVIIVRHRKGIWTKRIVGDMANDGRATLFDATGGRANIHLNTLIDPALGWPLHLAWSITNGQMWDFAAIQMVTTSAPFC